MDMEFLKCHQMAFSLVKYTQIRIRSVVKQHKSQPSLLISKYLNDSSPTFDLQNLELSTEILSCVFSAQVYQREKEEGIEKYFHSCTLKITDT